MNPSGPLSTREKARAQLVASAADPRLLRTWDRVWGSGGWEITTRALSSSSSVQACPRYARRSRLA
eukprot:5208395-Pyramimonas_sp.AAC.1